MIYAEVEGNEGALDFFGIKAKVGCRYSDFKLGQLSGGRGQRGRARPTRHQGQGRLSSK